MTTGPLRPFERVVVRNPPLHDGTPRHQNGYRCHLHWPFEEARNEGRLRSRVYQSPMLPTASAAMRWLPSVELISDHWSFAP